MFSDLKTSRDPFVSALKSYCEENRLPTESELVAIDVHKKLSELSGRIKSNVSFYRGIAMPASVKKKLNFFYVKIA